MTVFPPPGTRQDADALLRAGRQAEAIPILRALSEAAPEEESHLLALEWALHDSGRHQEAAECFERLFAQELVRQPFTGFAYDELVRIYREAGQWERLLAVCERAVAAQPEDTGLLRTLGDSLLVAGKAGQAVALFERLTGLEPDQPEFWCGLGNARLAAGEAGAAAAYDRAAALDPEGAPAFLHRLAEGLIATGRLAEARGILERCLALRPSEPLYRTALGDLHLRSGEIDAAREAYAAAAALQPAMAGAFWNRLGHRLQEGGMIPQAIEAFQQAAAADPDNPRYPLRLASLYASQGRASEAQAALQAAQRARRKPP